MVKSLGEAGAVVRLIAARLGTVAGGALEADATLETMPSVLFDAVIVPDGQGAAAELSSLGQALEFLKDQYRHCKPILMLGAGESVAAAAGIPLDDPEDWAVVRELPAFVEAVGKAPQLGPRARSAAGLRAVRSLRRGKKRSRT